MDSTVFCPPLISMCLVCFRVKTGSRLSNEDYYFMSECVCECVLILSIRFHGVVFAWHKRNVILMDDFMIVVINMVIRS